MNLNDFVDADIRRKERGYLIAFCGSKGSGKSTLANTIATKIPMCKRMAFADPLRLMLEAIGVSSYYHTDNKGMPIPFLPGNPTARHLLQTLGTEWGRDQVHSDLWAITALRRFEGELHRGNSVMVDDMRFPNEWEAIHATNGIIVRITRGALADDGDEHPSESHWRDFDYDFELKNDGTPEELLKAFHQGLNNHLLVS